MEIFYDDISWSQQVRFLIFLPMPWSAGVSKSFSVLTGLWLKNDFNFSFMPGKRCVLVEAYNNKKTFSAYCFPWPTLDRKPKCLHIICFKVASWSRRTRNSGTRTPCRPDGYDADNTFKGRRFADGLYAVVNCPVGWNCGDQVGLPFPNNIFFFMVSTLISVYILFYR